MILEQTNVEEIDADLRGRTFEKNIVVKKHKNMAVWVLKYWILFYNLGDLYDWQGHSVTGPNTSERNNIIMRYGLRLKKKTKKNPKKKQWR